LDAAQASQNITERKALYAKIQKKMKHDFVYIPLWYEPVIAVSNQRLVGYQPTSDGGFMGLLQAQLR